MGGAAKPQKAHGRAWGRGPHAPEEGGAGCVPNADWRAARGGEAAEGTRPGVGQGPPRSGGGRGWGPARGGEAAEDLVVLGRGDEADGDEGQADHEVGV